MGQNQAVELLLKSGALATVGGIVGRELWRQAKHGVFRAVYRKIRRSKVVKEVIALLWVLLPYLVIGAAAVYFGYPDAVIWIPVVLVGGIICRRKTPAALWFAGFCILAGAAAWVVMGQAGTLVVAGTFVVRYAANVLQLLL